MRYTRYCALFCLAMLLFVAPTAAQEVSLWTRVGTTPENVWALAAQEIGYVYAATDAGGYRLSAEGIKPAMLGTGLRSMVLAPDLNTIYVGTDQGKIYRIEPGGSWTKLHAGPVGLHINAFAFKPLGIYFAGTATGILRTRDGGATWHAIDTGLPDGAAVRALALTPSGALLAGTDAGLFRSDDDAKTWTETALEDRALRTLAAAGTTLFAGTDDGLFRSEDAGRTWQPLGLAETQVNALLLRGAGHLYAGTTQGVFHTGDGGLTWQPFADANLDGSVTVHTLALDGQGRLLAGTAQGVIFRSNASTDPGGAPEILPTEYALGQNYPNPFNPATTIPFELPETGFVSLSVFNMLGQVVETLVSGTFKAGRYEVEWQPEDLPSGLYLFRLETEGFAQTRQLVLLK